MRFFKTFSKCYLCNLLQLVIQKIQIFRANFSCIQVFETIVCNVLQVIYEEKK